MRKTEVTAPDCPLEGTEGSRWSSGARPATRPWRRRLLGRDNGVGTYSGGGGTGDRSCHI